MARPGACVNRHKVIAAAAQPSMAQRLGPNRQPPRTASTANTTIAPASCSDARLSAAQGGFWAAWTASRMLYSMVQISHAAGSGSLVRRQASRRYGM